MFIPLGFGKRSINTFLGDMVYYTAIDEPWNKNGAKESEKTLVFLHAFGGGSSAYEWSKVYPAFATEYRILAPDLIGWGRSNHPAKQYRIDEYIRIILEFIEKTCDRPVTVIASGLTAAFTIRTAINRPELFKSLILVTPAGLAEFGTDYSQSIAAKVVKIPVLNQILYSAGVASALGVRSYLEQRQFAHPERIYPEIVDAYLASAEQPNAEYAALSFVSGDLSFDLGEYINLLSIPTAIIWGKESEFTSPEIGRRFAKMNPKAIRFFYHSDDFGFTPQLELPAVTIGLIRKFLPLLDAEPTS
ncbi:alpha/beta fold hydrolase [Floridanema evergladense]|uniref:Alpha/beta fold hydrolase n=1 Tax=Floridaenema evergladense BLCC-F167 TaxID=3153639 RepID=A0ABV4WTM0_9CYAN